VGLKDAVSAALARRGYELRRTNAPPPREPRPAPAGERLVTAPAFILCSVRSGSTLLRVLLNSHSQLFAPQELHFRFIRVRLTRHWSKRAMGELGLDKEGLEYLLWDRILHRQLSASGKPRLVSKTPSDVFIADRIRACWPDARFIFLLRHPAAIARSRLAVARDRDPEKNVRVVRRYCEALEAARQAYDGITVRYEDLTADPAGETRRICEYLGVEWEPAMLEYGRGDHGRYKAGLGDWAEKIRSGAVQAATPPPPLEETPEPLRELAEAWGYAPSRAGGRR
jgi:hypothetical protein